MECGKLCDPGLWEERYICVGCLVGVVTNLKEKITKLVEDGILTSEQSAYLFDINVHIEKVEEPVGLVLYAILDVESWGKMVPMVHLTMEDNIQGPGCDQLPEAVINALQNADFGEECEGMYSHYGKACPDQIRKILANIKEISFREDEEYTELVRKMTT